MKAKRALIVGCGRMGVHPSTRAQGEVPAGWLPISHIEALQATGAIEEFALCDTSSEALAKWKSHYSVERGYLDFKNAIDDFKPDLVTIATRTPIKKSILEYCCAKRVQGVYVEKPIANSLKDCVEILASIEHSETRIGYGVNRRFHAVYREAKRLLSEGTIGKPIEVNVEFGDSRLLWTHPHTVDLISFLLDAPKLKTVQAQLTDETVDRKSELLVDSDPAVRFAHFEFENGASANILRTKGLNVRIAGTEGIITIPANGASIIVESKSGPSATYFLKETRSTELHAISATTTAMSELLRSMEEHTESPISPNAIADGIRMLMGVAWSHLQKGGVVTSSEIPTDLTVTGRWGELHA